MDISEDRTKKLIKDKSEGVKMTGDQTSETLLPSPDLKTTYTVSSNEDEVTLFNSYPGPLARSLADIRNVTSKWEELSRTEVMMSNKFSLSDSERTLIQQNTRETTNKASFNYLFLDPDISTNLPMIFRESKQDLWRRFIEAIFYIGRGVRSRPMQHLVEASKTFGIASSIEKLSEKKYKKISKIHKIWENGRGVVVLQVFQNTMAPEAITREALMIEAIGLDNLTNLNPGDLKGEARNWGKDGRLEFGTFLLYKAFLIHLIDGEKQIRPGEVTFN